MMTDDANDNDGLEWTISMGINDAVAAPGSHMNGFSGFG